MIDLETIEREIDKLEHLAIPFGYVFKLVSVSLLLIALKTALYGIKSKSSLSGSFSCGAISSNFNPVFELHAWFRLFCRSTLVGQSHCSIVDIVLVRTPFKIVSTIVDFALVFMVDLIQSFWVRAKRHSDKTMYSVSFPHAVTIENHALIASRFAERQAHNLARPQAFHAPKVRNLIQAFVSSNVFPVFHHAPI